MYRDVPLPKSPFGEQMYDAGRRLVTTGGVALDRLVWDADEVLWDWVMSVGRMLRSVTQLFRRDFSHREFYRVKAGLFELLWGMHHAALDTGSDPFVRLWTDGYPWRLWQISLRIPGFAELLGPVDGAPPADAEAFARHPHIFSRPDFGAALEVLVGWYRDDPELTRLAEPVRSLVLERLRRRRLRSTWKLPELAAWIGKHGFDRAAVLIDDKARNVRDFTATGRRAVRVVNRTPHVLFGRVPNSVWSEPEARLEGLATRVAAPLSAALPRALQAPAGQIVEVVCDEPAPPHEPIAFTIDVPDARIRAEWIEPVRRARALLDGRDVPSGQGNAGVSGR